MKQASPGYQAIRYVAAAMFSAATVAAPSPACADAIQFNPDGDGYAGAIALAPGSWIDAHGSGFAMLMPGTTDPVDFTFVETGAYRMTAPDGVSAMGSQDITLTYSILGTVNVFSGIAKFHSGLINLYADTRFDFGAVAPGSPVVFGANDGTAIGSFAVTAGGGAADSTVALQARSIAGTVLPGYFFSTTGDDLALSQGLNLSVNIGNQIDPTPSAAVVSEIVCKAAGFPGPGCMGGTYANTPGYFVVTDHAQALLSAVPEPASMALLLAGLGGVATVVGVKGRRAR